ncbi:coiled-coil domain-containing protein 53 [Anopheles darlingi]|uniref:Coiled-coil domain-containing protein 53 n=1 Tax=Anopheles darlingi TaxID=43151 RepID=W5JUE4_ANODA|nr:coiled-coil domain-containing protein 53 [Anopheles darlingi]
MDTITVQKHELPPTSQKRMLAFINHFIVSTVTFLNQFASDCETRFVTFEHKLQNLEASLMIVEAKLASIDVLKQPGGNQPVETPPTSTLAAESAVSDPAETAVEVKEPEPTAKAKPDAQYDLYFKMIHLGVPLNAVKNKINSEGLDPNYIDQFL